MLGPPRSVTSDGGSTVIEYLHDALLAGGRPQDVAVRSDENAFSFLDLVDMSGALAADLHDRGVGPGDRVAVMASNRVEFFAAVNGVSSLGAASVLLSPAWKRAEVAHALGLTNPTIAIADGASVELLQAFGAVVDLDATPADADAPPSRSLDPSAECVLVFSSGTTGMPKAVRHSHTTFGHAVRHWTSCLGLTGQDRLQIATPPSHILGLLNLVTAAAAGASVRLHRRFDLDEVLRRIEGDRVTIEMAVAPIAQAMANHPTIENYDLSSLRYIVWGATPVVPSIAEAVSRRTGVRWLPGYGASEVPVITCNPVSDPARWRLDSAGLPAEGVEVRVVDPVSGDVLGAEATGEIQVRSPSAMLGYLPSTAEADAFVDGWYRTGDIGWMEPDGWIHLTDRLKEMIKVKAFQVAPAEIEAVLVGQPGVVDCAVFGVPDEAAGELPVAAVRVTEGALVSAEHLITAVAEGLATYKRLSAVVFVDEIPRLPSGKALRRELRDRWLQGTLVAPAEPPEAV